MKGANVSTEAFGRHLAAWHLTSDGEPIETNTSWLLPVQQNHRPAMLKVFKPDSDEQNSADVLLYFGGLDSVLAIDAGLSALLLERAEGTRSFISPALSGGDDKAAEILAGVVQQLHQAHDRERPAHLFSLMDWFKTLFMHERELPILRRHPPSHVVAYLIACGQPSLGPLRCSSIIPLRRVYCGVSLRWRAGDLTP